MTVSLNKMSKLADWNINLTDQTEKSPAEDKRPFNDVPAFGGELMRARKQAGLTLDELARRSGVSKSILSQIERDGTNPTVATIWRICSALDFAPERLFQEADRKSAGIDFLARNATPEIRSDDNLCSLRILGAIDLVNVVQWYVLEAEPGGALTSEPHGEGTSEHLTIQEGSFTVVANGVEKSGEAGDTLRYATEEGTHTIRNTGTRPARAIMICDLQGAGRPLSALQNR